MALEADINCRGISNPGDALAAADKILGHNGFLRRAYPGGVWGIWPSSTEWHPFFLICKITAESVCEDIVCMHVHFAFRRPVTLFVRAWQSGLAVLGAVLLVTSFFSINNAEIIERLGSSLALFSLAGFVELAIQLIWKRSAGKRSELITELCNIERDTELVKTGSSGVVLKSEERGTHHH